LGTGLITCGKPARRAACQYPLVQELSQGVTSPLSCRTCSAIGGDQGDGRFQEAPPRQEPAGERTDRSDHQRSCEDRDDDLGSRMDARARAPAKRDRSRTPPLGDAREPVRTPSALDAYQAGCGRCFLIQLTSNKPRWLLASTLRHPSWSGQSKSEGLAAWTFGSVALTWRAVRG